MEIEAYTISIWKNGDVDGDEAPRQLIDALESFAKSRATRRLFREAEDRNVHCDLRVPLVKDCRVRPSELARALRKLYRAVIDTAQPGERFVIDFYPKTESQFSVKAARNT